MYHIPVRVCNVTYLIRQHCGAEIPQRQLQLLDAVVDGDLDGDGRVARQAVAVAAVVCRGCHARRCAAGGLCGVELSLMR